MGNGSEVMGLIFTQYPLPLTNRLEMQELTGVNIILRISRMGMEIFPQHPYLD
jgi:hypothetical protein